MAVSQRADMSANFIGFVAGAVIPAEYGVYIVAHEIAYRAAMPLIPNTAYCGNGMLGACLLILFVAPVCGAIGAAIGRACSVICRQLHSTRSN